MNKRIMVIDDSATVRKIIEVFLHREGYEVQSFHDGMQALQYLAGPHACVPHLILLDINLPKIDGYEVLRHVKAKPQCSQTVIMIISRRDGLLDRLKGRLAGATTYLTKPFKTQDLLIAVQASIGPPQEPQKRASYVHGNLTSYGNNTHRPRTRKVTLVPQR